MATTADIETKKNSHSSPLSPWYVAGCLGSHVPVASKGIQHVGLSGPGQTVPMVCMGHQLEGKHKMLRSPRRVEM